MKIANHILFLVPGFPKDENDFNCIPPLQEFLQKFISTHPSIKISVIAFQYPYLNKTYLWEGNNVVPLDGKNSVFKKPIVWLKAIQEAKKIYKSFPIDVIHSLWVGECALIGNYLSKKIGCEHICTLMGQDVKSSNKYLGWLKHSRTKFVALSNNQAELFIKLSNKKVSEIIHWGIDDQQVNIKNRDIDLLGVGSLIPLKNYSLFIKTVEEIVKSKPDLNCILVGSGPESEKLKTMLKEKCLGKNIQFKGLLNRTEIFSLMQRSKIFLHPSTFEGSGFVFAEALVNGMNIVSFNVGYAQNHPKWFIANDNQDFIRITKELLDKQLSYEPINLFPLEETVQKYFALYNS
jgi:glycosyltransferase involved in cell wall biosynthesis